MIKRWYILSVKKPHDDNNGSYSYRHDVFFNISWFSQPDHAFVEAYAHATESMKDIPGSESLDVICFNQI